MCLLHRSQGQLVVLLAQWDGKKKSKEPDDILYKWFTIYFCWFSLYDLHQNIKVLTIRTCAQLLHSSVWENFSTSGFWTQGFTDPLKFWGSMNLVPCTLFYARKNILRRGPETFTRPPGRSTIQKQLSSTILGNQGRQGVQGSPPTGTQISCKHQPRKRCGALRKPVNICEGKRAGLQARPRR